MNAANFVSAAASVTHSPTSSHKDSRRRFNASQAVRLGTFFVPLPQSPRVAGSDIVKTEFLLVISCFESEHFPVPGMTGKRLILTRPSVVRTAVGQGVWAIACYGYKACSETCSHRSKCRKQVTGNSSHAPVFMPFHCLKSENSAGRGEPAGNKHL